VRYDPGGFFCEMVGGADRQRLATRVIRQRLEAIAPESLDERAAAADRELYNLGITFTVYSASSQIDRVLPFDLIPRILSPDEWASLEAGIAQRVQALNLFLHDVYHEQRILKDGVVPSDLVLENVAFRPEMIGLDLPQHAYVHIAGIDLVRGDDGRFMVLEDNARTPSGVSYVLENRALMARSFSDLMAGIGVRRVDLYGLKLHEALLQVAPPGSDDPQVVLLSPGAFNSAYFEHVFLAREMGVPLVEGQDLVVDDDRVFMKTTAGLTPVDVIYRRIDDAFLDPLAFRFDSLIGVPGLFAAYRKGRVNIANAVGTGVADDKAVYAYMPRIIRYYLDADPILANVETRICREPEGLAYTLAHLHELVVKPVSESGGYGIVVGPRASRAELDDVRAKIIANPANFISQPMIRLSVAPTLIERQIEPRHVDLRPFAVTGAETWVLPGGLTRVALRKGSLVVNSSQGGGSKDTWVLA
jgi:uncharacterized circularly permuted ATP-grasp superfamily protein